MYKLGFVYSLFLLISCSTTLNAIEFKPYLQVAPSAYMLELELFNQTSKNTMFGGFVGAGVEFYPWLAIEGRGGGSFKNEDSLAGTKYNSKVQFPLLSIFAKPMIPMNDWYIYGLLGATVSPDYALTTPAGVTTTTKKKTALSYGLGAGYQISEALSANLEVLRYHKTLGASNELKARLDGVSLVLNYYFDLSNSDEGRSGKESVEERQVVIVEPPEAFVEKEVVFSQESIYFESYSSTLSMAGMKKLDVLDVSLKGSQEYKLKIEGYSDASGPEGYNLWLSHLRAVSVESYLKDKGVEGARLFTVGLGEASPIADNETQEGRAKNRRVSINKQDSIVLQTDKTMLLRGVQFETDSYALNVESQNSLQQLIMMLKEYDSIQVKVMGHTDTMGRAEYNLSLSKKRAHAVADYIVHQGITSSRVISVGYGGSVPISNNVTKEGRALNRRVEVRLDK